MKSNNKIAISGLGRIGRSILKKNGLNNQFNVSFCNDVNPDIKNLAYLLRYDSTYGKYDKEIKFTDNKIIINNQEIDYLVNQSLYDIDWEKYQTDILIISSGIEKSVKEAHELILKGAIKKVIVTHCSSNADKEIILGVNEDTINEKDSIISNSICDANAIAHIVKWLDNEFEIQSGSLTTLHPWLGYQNLLDGFSFSHSNPGFPWPDYALARSSIDNLIPKKTTALSAVESVVPNIKNKMLSFSYRVPTNVVSSSDLTLNLKKEISLNEFNNFLVDQSKKSKYVSLNYESLVSQDYKSNESSAIIDMQWNQKVGNTFKIVLWYDNEWGYSSRVIDLVEFLSK
jgi:glyceraldehyde 3-phosphate dehydrogenase|tara:strand:- start:2790 stop:3818 length:1029 start_codon:yes stop_codon:yes gene_type:complete